MKTKLIALLLLVVLTLSLASCDFFETGFLGKIFGKEPATTTVVTTADGGLTDPLRTEPAKVTTALSPSGEISEWGPETPVK